MKYRRGEENIKQIKYFKNIQPLRAFRDLELEVGQSVWLRVCRSVSNGKQLCPKWTQHGSGFGAAYFVPFRTHRGAWGSCRIALGSDSAPIGMHRGSFGSQLRPIQHPSGGRGAQWDRNCVPISTHRCVRTPVFDVPKKMTQTKTLVFSFFGVPKIGTAKI